MRRPHRHKLIVTGFSLIEVLIAVIVLAVGLLGLASVFPVVITQQRQASDIILGGVASSVIRDQIAMNPDIAGELLSQDGYADVDEPDADGDRVANENPGTDNDPDVVVGTGEPIFGQHISYLIGSSLSNEVFNHHTGYSYRWEADWQWGSRNNNLDLGPRTVLVSNGTINRDAYIEDGGVRYRDPGERVLASVPAQAADLPIAARLFPPAYSVEGVQNDGPQFVWDFVPRRSPEGGIQMAVFVRRIDTGIHIFEDRTLSDMLLAKPGQDEHRFAVGRDDNTGEPTFDGTGEYSIPLSVKAEPVPSDEYPQSPEFNATPRLDVLLDAVRLDAAASSDPDLSTARISELRFLAQRGQLFVDNLGVVRRVIEVLKVDGTVVDLRVDPPYPLNQLFLSFDDVVSINSDSLRESARAGKLRQIVFTPQTPVDVFVMEFNQQ